MSQLPFTSGHTVVGTTRTKVIGKRINTGFTEVVIKALGKKDDKSNSVAVYIGGPNCTASFHSCSGGFPLAPGDFIVVPVEAAGDLHAVATSNSQVVSWYLR